MTEAPLDEENLVALESSVTAGMQTKDSCLM